MPRQRVKAPKKWRGEVKREQESLVERIQRLSDPRSNRTIYIRRRGKWIRSFAFRCSHPTSQNWMVHIKIKDEQIAVDARHFLFENEYTESTVEHLRLKTRIQKEADKMEDQESE